MKARNIMKDEKEENKKPKRVVLGTREEVNELSFRYHLIKENFKQKG